MVYLKHYIDTLVEKQTNINSTKHLKDEEIKYAMNKMYPLSHGKAYVVKNI